jgi:integrase
MRSWNKLSAVFVRNARREGRYSDGGNLYLQVANGGKSWLFQYQRHGRQHDMGLGAARAVPLALARELRDGCHVTLARGLDPIEARKTGALAARAASAKEMTFQQCAEEYLAANASKWRNDKHRKQWMATLTQYAYPVFGKLSVTAIDSGLVFKVLQPLIPAKAITAGRLRGRIEAVLDFAKAAGRRTGDNPAEKVIIGHMLPLRPEKAAVRHQPALPFDQLPAFMAAARAAPGLPARLLEMIVLTGMRFEAVQFARCAEFDLAAAVPEWVIPKARMKNLGRDQRIPLVGRALAIARELTVDRDPAALVFAGEKLGKPISPNTVREDLMPALLEAIGFAGPAVPHGFRSCLKDWAHETTAGFPDAVIEQALGHRIKGAVERAYRRGDLFNRRRDLMAAWDRFCGGTGAAVVEMQGRRRAKAAASDSR